MGEYAVDEITPILVIAALVLLALFLLGVAIGLLFAALGGAVILFAWAAEQGFVGVAAYVASWVFLFPIMLVASIVVGLFAAYSS